MKIRITRKQASQMGNVRCAGYCDLSSLLCGVDATAYTAGVYGWNFDVYEFQGLTICTGLRGMPGPALDGVREYEKKACDILHDYSQPFEDRMAQVAEIRAEFIRLNGGEA